ncbi:MAG TPA: hypothetical protein VFT48_13310 [Pyrinomonadaceae bacterium]|nr:hypothetical protein [Pyrinomonadaceae bacterium]
MKRTELSEAAAVLKALTAGWALVDKGPEIDFLVFVSEDRDELDFYPKKSFVGMMESSGLIENPDKQGSSLRQPYTYYEAGPSVWKEVTVAGPIVFQYRVTQKGRTLLRDTPRLTGKPVRALRPATSPVDTRSEPLRVVTYDRPAIQKLVDAFDQKAAALIEAAFSPKTDLDRASSSSRRIVCGPRLWQTLEPHARRNGLQPSGSLLSVTYDLAGKGAKQKESTRKLADQLILPSDEARRFWQTLREAFKIDGPLTIRRAVSGEQSAYTYHEEIENDDFPPPDLAGRTVLFIVEVNKSRFMVLVKNVPDDNMEHFEPDVSWVETMPER